MLGHQQNANTLRQPEKRQVIQLKAKYLSLNQQLSEPVLAA
jgi:hypothetical protein